MDGKISRILFGLLLLIAGSFAVSALATANKTGVLPSANDIGTNIMRNSQNLGNANRGAINWDEVFANKKVALAINPINTSQANQYGTATITADDSKVKVELNVNTPTGVSEPQPAGVYRGDCTSTGELLAPLQDVNNGKSNTELMYKIQDKNVGQLRQELPLSIKISRSKNENQTIISCADAKQ